MKKYSECLSSFLIKYIALWLIDKFLLETLLNGDHSTINFGGNKSEISYISIDVKNDRKIFRYV